MASTTCLACALEQANRTYGIHAYNDTQHTCTKNPHISSSSVSSEDASSTASAYTFDSYQDDAGTTAIYPGAGTCAEEAVTYVILGLIGEAGEIANKWKKLIRDAPNKHNEPTEYYEYYANLRSAIIDELGDVLWYAANAATELGASLGEVAAENIRKLNDRKSRNVLSGNGDDR